MSVGLPLPVVLCLAGLTVLGGGTLWVLHRWIARRGVWARVRALHREERATSAVETPFSLLVLILVTLCVWQLGLLASAYQVMDYAAFSAARNAAVIIPQDYTVEVVQAPSAVDPYKYWFIEVLFDTKKEAQGAGITTYKHRLLSTKFPHPAWETWPKKSTYQRWKGEARFAEGVALQALRDLLALVRDRQRSMKELRDKNPLRWVLARGPEVEANCAGYVGGIRGVLRRIERETVIAYDGERPNQLATYDSGVLPRPLPTTIVDLLGETLAPDKGRDLYQGAAWSCIPISGLQENVTFETGLQEQFDKAENALLDEVLLIAQGLEAALAAIPQEEADTFDPDDKLQNVAVEAAKEALTEAVHRVADVIRPQLEAIRDVSVSGDSAMARWAQRYLYARANTRLEITPEVRMPGTYSGGQAVTCTVTHRYHLPIFFARSIFSLMGGGEDDEAGGYWIPLRASASVITEGFVEKRPADAPDDAGPNLLPGE